MFRSFSGRVFHNSGPLLLMLLSAKDFLLVKCIVTLGAVPTLPLLVFHYNVYRGEATNHRSLYEITNLQMNTYLVTL